MYDDQQLTLSISPPGGGAQIWYERGVPVGVGASFVVDASGYEQDESRNIDVVFFSGGILQR